MISRYWCCLLLVLLYDRPSAWGAVYTWKDSGGVIHYTNKDYEIPERYRPRARTLYPDQAEQPSDVARQASVTPPPSSPPPAAAPAAPLQPAASPPPAATTATAPPAENKSSASRRMRISQPRAQRSEPLESE